MILIFLINSNVKQFEVPDMEKISQEMKEKNITTYFLDVWDYVKDETTKEIDEHSLIEAVKLIDPTIIFLVICYSSNLNLKFLLEGSGILSEIRMNRDLCIQSRGKIMTMSKVQKEFLQTMSKPENITKRIVEIQGQVGSGKTLLGIELLKMKIAFYLKFHGLSADEGREQIRAIIVIELSNGRDLKNHLEEELSEVLSRQASFEIHNKDLDPESLKEIIENPKDFTKFKETIVLVDECLICRMRLADRYTVKELEETIKIDYIHCIKHRDLEMKSKMVGEKVYVDKESVFVTLLQKQRSSQPILDLTYFADRHRNNPWNPLPGIYKSNDSFQGSKPRWVEVEDFEAFVKFANENLSEFRGEAMIIRSEYTKALPAIASICSKLEWRYCHGAEVRGSEASLVIFYDFDPFNFESFTRAKHNLLIVTLRDKR